MKTSLKLKKVWKKPSLAVHSRMLTESGSQNKCENLNTGPGDLC